MQIELKQRVVSGVLLGLVVLALTYIGGLPFKVFAGFLALLIHYEWTTIIGAGTRSPRALALAWAAVGLSVVFTLAGAGVPAVITIVIGGAAAGLYAGSAARGAWLALGVFYAGFSGLAIAEIRDDTALGLVAMVFVFAVVWATDIVAYFGGKTLGGPKLAVKISPGKTWSGAMCGLFAGALAGLIVAAAALEETSGSVLILAGVLSAASQSGDLFESWMKRKYAVKDSSRLIPGHGGVMDRVDGLVFAAFAAFVIAVVASGGFPTTESGSPIAARLFGV